MTSSHRYVSLACFLAANIGLTAISQADTLTLPSGMQISGRVGQVSSFNQNPNAPQAAGMATTMLAVDDDLRRTFFPKQGVKLVPGNLPQEKFKLTKGVASVGKMVPRVGGDIHISDFDNFGNRTYTLRTDKGPMSIVQGITEFTPLFAKVEGLRVQQPVVWDMRIATKSIPHEVLAKIMMRAIDPKKADDRVRVVRFFIQSERYFDAHQELEKAIKDFPDLAELAKIKKELLQLSANQWLREIEQRRDVGQHRFARNLLDSFPTEGIAGETLIRVRELLAEYDDVIKKGEQALALLKEHGSAIEARDKALFARLKPVLDEMTAELNPHNLPRLFDYLRLADDEKMEVDQKLAIAISGWLLGTASNGVNLTVSISLFETRDRIRAYLRSKLKDDRRKIIAELESSEGGTADYVSKLLAYMKPPSETKPQQENEPGFLQLTTPGITGEPDIEYCVQLPPEYDPYRRYPCILALGGAGEKAKDQVAWWAGPFSEKFGIHTGKASQQGYIVLSPTWTKPHQGDYGYSAREHSIVLGSLRDACRRFSIDTDRVFISGHSIGGTAAWDIAVAHPDLWAGVIPIAASADKYIKFYKQNARRLSMYFLLGELDGNKIEANGPIWDDYMKSTGYGRIGYDVIVVEYLGRGPETFEEEQDRMFTWMNFHSRQPAPDKFEFHALRSWDNFFWAVEVDDYPSDRMVSPQSFLVSGNKGAVSTEFDLVRTSNKVTVKSAAKKKTLMLSREQFDFDKKIILNGSPKAIQPSLETILEDARTRVDRLHPFWAKVQF